MEALEIIMHLGHVAAALLLLYATFIAMKKFKLAIWRKGWLVVGLASVVLIFGHIFLFFNFESIFEAAETASIFFIVIGVLMLAKSADKIWRGVR